MVELVGRGKEERREGGRGGVNERHLCWVLWQLPFTNEATGINVIEIFAIFMVPLRSLTPSRRPRLCTCAYTLVQARNPPT